MVQDSLLSFDAERYFLFAWVVMPNHIHALFQPQNGWTIAKIVGSWKKYTGRRINDLRRSTNDPHSGEPVWHREYWDRYVRDEQHFYTAREYIHQNPVKAGLVARPDDLRWSSATAGRED